jgi:hypothetical protein
MTDRIFREVGVAYFKALTRYLPEETGQNYEKSVNDRSHLGFGTCTSVTLLRLHCLAF